MDIPFKVKSVADLVQSGRKKMLCGHFPYGRYMRIFPEGRVVSFVREPLQRCYSEFLHLQREQRWKKSFAEFIELPMQINRQSKLLDGVGDDVLIGVSEYYGQSIKMINKSLGLSVPAMVLNTNRGNVNKPYSIEEIGQDIADRFYALNQDDIFLYQEVLGRLFRNSEYGFSNFSEFFHSVKQKVKNKLFTLPSR